MALAAGQWPVAEVASREGLASQGPPGDKTRQYRLLRREGESVLLLVVVAIFSLTNKSWFL